MSVLLYKSKLTRLQIPKNEKINKLLSRIFALITPYFWQNKSRA